MRASIIFLVIAFVGCKPRVQSDVHGVSPNSMDNPGVFVLDADNRLTIRASKLEGCPKDFEPYQCRDFAPVNVTELRTRMYMALLQEITAMSRVLVPSPETFAAMFYLADHRFNSLVMAIQSWKVKGKNWHDLTSEFAPAFSYVMQALEGGDTQSGITGQVDKEIDVGPDAFSMLCTTVSAKNNQTFLCAWKELELLCRIHTVRIGGRETMIDSLVISPSIGQRNYARSVFFRPDQPQTFDERTPSVVEGLKKLCKTVMPAETKNDILFESAEDSVNLRTSMCYRAGELQSCFSRASGPDFKACASWTDANGGQFQISTPDLVVSGGRCLPSQGQRTGP